jgi:DNA-binding response OmpR family regulator
MARSSILFVCADASDGACARACLAEQHNLRLTLVPTGERGIEMLATCRSDLAIIAVPLPTLDGDALARTALLNEVPVLFTSSDPRTIAELEYCEYPVLRMPVRPEHFVKTARWLIQSAQSDPEQLLEAMLRSLCLHEELRSVAAASKDIVADVRSTAYDCRSASHARVPGHLRPMSCGRP